MKKFFLFAAALVAAMTVNAQEKVEKHISDYANYIEFQALVDADATLTSKPMSSTESVTLPNGTVLLGKANSSGEETTCTWNAKPEYNTVYGVADGLPGVDSLRVGTQWRAGSGCTMTLGAFETTADGKLKVFYQLHGNDASKTGENVRGIACSIMNGEFVEYRFATGKNLCVAQFDLPADSYDAGDVVLKVLKNTINVCGVQIENLKGGQQGIEDVVATGKAVKVIENGQIVIIKNGVRYNALGAAL